MKKYDSPSITLIITDVDVLNASPVSDKNLDDGFWGLGNGGSGND